jgi:hypothetical protein
MNKTMSDPLDAIVDDPHATKTEHETSIGHSRTRRKPRPVKVPGESKASRRMRRAAVFK